MLVVIERQIALPLRLPHARQPIRRRKLRHQQPATRLRVADFRFDSGIPGARSLVLAVAQLLLFREQARMPDEPPKHGIRHARHRRKHRRRRHQDVSDAHLRRNPRRRGHGMLYRVVPVLLHRESFACHGCLVQSRLTAMSRKLSLQQTWAPATAEAHSIQLLRLLYFAGAASLALAYFRRKRSTRPAVSTRRCLPVKNGWHTEQIST